MELKGRRIHIVGSSDVEADEVKLVYAHSLIASLTRALASEGCNFVVPFSKEPKLKDRTEGPSIIFDWTVSETILESLQSGASVASGPNGRLISTVSTNRTSQNIPSSRIAIFETLRSADCIKFEFLDPGWNAGAYSRARLAQLGDILICLSGGQGVEQLAVEYSSRGKPVVPLDLDLGSSSRDGAGGASRLFDRARSEPDKFFRVGPSVSGADLLDRTKTSGGSVPVDSVVAAVCSLLHAIAPPRAFYVRLLNPTVAEYAMVEDFFRSSVDVLVQEIGYEPLQMGLGKNEFAWMNQAIFDSLHHSGVVVVDLAGLRPNCFMELGYALGNNQRVIVTAHKDTQISFDAFALEAFLWDPSEDLNDRLNRFRVHWERNIDMPPLVRPVEAK